jgi:polysaccharide export outer membrane protein
MLRGYSKKQHAASYVCEHAIKTNLRWDMGIRPVRLLFGAMALVLAWLGCAPAAFAQLTQPEYTLNAGDTLDVSVYKEDELTKTVIVRPDGKFSFPLAGEIVASGRTITQVEADITSRLLKYIPEAVVSAAVKTLDGCRIYIIGQVSKPGSFVMNPRMNVLQALSLAGGTTPFASVNDIIVVRGQGAQQKVLPFKYSEVAKGRDLSQNVMLESGDVLVVP